MHRQTKHRPTIGFISTWPIYQGTTIDRYAHSLIQGISAAANKQDAISIGLWFQYHGQRCGWRDSAERLQAYHLALRAARLPENPNLIAFGEG